MASILFFENFRGNLSCYYTKVRSFRIPLYITFLNPKILGSLFCMKNYYKSLSFFKELISLREKKFSFPLPFNKGFGLSWDTHFLIDSFSLPLISLIIWCVLNRWLWAASRCKRERGVLRRHAWLPRTLRSFLRPYLQAPATPQGIQTHNSLPVLKL